MTEHMMTCPHCGKEFPMTQALSHEFKSELENEIRLKAQEDNVASLKILQEQLEAERKKRKEAEESELNLRKERQKLQEEKEEWELAKERQLDEERDIIRQKTAEKFAEKQELKDREKDELIKSLREKIEDLNQRAEQGSQQTQGEILELVIEDFLKEKFPLDEIVAVPKGLNGADILQKVRNKHGDRCGTIIWETKRTKAWSDGWCEKLKEDQQKAKADIAILLSSALPKDITGFGQYQGIWVTDRACSFSLTQAMRMNLMSLNEVRRAAEDRGTKVEDLYNYLTSPEFTQRVSTIVEYFTAMKEDLDKEKKAIQKLWEKREKQIEKVTEKTIQIQGHLEAIIGRPMMQIEKLELATLAAPREIEVDNATDIRVIN